MCTSYHYMRRRSFSQMTETQTMAATKASHVCSDEETVFCFSVMKEFNILGSLDGKRIEMPTYQVCSPQVKGTGVSD